MQIQGPTHPSRGYSAMRFLPDTNDTHIVATKTVEPNDGSNNMSYITVLTIDGQVMLPGLNDTGTCVDQVEHEKGNPTDGRSA